MAEGLSRRERNETYVGFTKGVFVRRVKEASHETITRTLTKGPNKGDEVHEIHFDALAGTLVDVKKDSHEEYGKSWEFHFDAKLSEDITERFILKLGYDNGHAKSLIKKLPNTDFSKVISLENHRFTPEGKTKERVGFHMRHYGEKATIKPAYTRENPNGLPEVKVVMVKNEEVYDDGEQLLFFEKMINEEIRPKLSGYTQPYSGESVEDSEDLPF